VTIKSRAGSSPAPGTMPQLPKYKAPIWSPQIAYAVGLITTDGSLSKDKRHIAFTSTDIELITTFLKCLNKTAKISNNPPSALSKKPAFRTEMSDVALYRWLEDIGLTNNKSLTLSSLNVPTEFFPDFLRGHLDGDGSIINYVDRYNTKFKEKYIYERLFVYFISCSERHIIWLREQIHSNKGIRGSLSHRITKEQKGTNQLWILKFSTKQAKIILNWIYYRNGLPTLERKLEKAKPFLNLYNSA
jgi:hypothetical protein